MKRRIHAVLGLAAMGLMACSGGTGGREELRTRADETVSFEAFQFETSAGPFTAIIYPEVAPETVERYKEYVDTGYYAGRSFGRVVPGFVIQVTDRVLGLTEDDRTLPLEPSFVHGFSAGSLGIARGSSQNSGGPEFFVMDFASGHLNTQYTMFGQVVEGIEVIRAIARVPALDWAETTGQSPLLFDRWAIEPVEITSVTHASIEMSAAEAAQYPLRTAERFRDENHAHNLEWPANLRSGQSSTLRWYITDFSGSNPPPAAESVVISIADETLPVSGEGPAGVYRFDWTPASKGTVPATLIADGTPWATLEIKVPR